MTHEYTFGMIDMTTSEREALEDVRIDTGNGRMNAHEIMWGMQNALDDYKTRLSQQNAVNDSLVKEMEQASEVIANVRRELVDTHEHYQRVAVEIAARLASAGSYDHRAKNEAILSAVARLLAQGTNRVGHGDMDDIPF